MRAKDFIPGLHKDPPDPRDWLYSKVRAAVPLPKKFCWDLTSLPVRDQGNWGTCAGHAGAQCKELYTWNKRQKSMRYSPRFLYTLCKQHDELPEGTEGTTLRALAKVMTEYGVCEEDLMPYMPSYKDLYNPSAKMLENAKLHVIKGYARCQTQQELKQALIEQGPVVFGLQLTHTFIEDAKNGVVPEKYGGLLIGGHAMTLIGYDDEKGWYIILNSWGIKPPVTDNKGLNYIPYSYMHATLKDFGNAPILQDAWAILQRDIPFQDIWGHWAQADIEKATEAGLLAGFPDGTFRPEAPVTRAQMAVLLNKLAKG